MVARRLPWHSRSLNQRHLIGNRKFVDSLLEEDGFELPVRGRGKPGYRPFCPAQAPTRSVNVPLITNDGRVLAEGGAVGIDALTPRALQDRQGESG